MTNVIVHSLVLLGTIKSALVVVKLLLICPSSSPSWKVTGYMSLIVAVWKKLDLYTNIWPVIAVCPRTLQQLVDLNTFLNQVSTKMDTPSKVNMIVVRENMECFISWLGSLQMYTNSSLLP